MPFGNFVLDTYGAPGLSALTECNAPEIDEPPNYLGSFVLNSILAMRYADPVGRMVFTYGRRAEHAVREYRVGRELLKSYVEPPARPWWQSLAHG